MFWTLYLVDCSLHFVQVFFLEFFLFFHLGHGYLSPNLSTSLCLFIFIRFIFTMSPSLGRVALYRKWSVGPSNVISLSTWARCYKSVPCVGCVCSPPPLQLSFDCCWNVSGWVWSSGWLVVRIGHDHSVLVVCVCGGGHWPHGVGIFSGLWCLLSPLFECVICGANQMVLLC